MAVKEDASRFGVPDTKTIASALQTTIRVWRGTCKVTTKDECHDEKCPFSVMCLSTPEEMDETATTLQIMQDLRGCDYAG